MSTNKGRCVTCQRFGWSALHQQQVWRLAKPMACTLAALQLADRPKAGQQANSGFAEVQHPREAL